MYIFTHTSNKKESPHEGTQFALINQSSMKKLRMLRVAFDTHIRPFEIPAFRGAIASKVGLEHEWFHNHNNSKQAVDVDNLQDLSTTRYHYRYPLIQYKTKHHNGAFQPMIICLGEGVEEAHKFFAQSNWEVDINGQQHQLSISKLDVHQHNIQVWEREFTYNLFKWQALNQKDFRYYQQLEALSDRYQFLDDKLVKNIVAFGMGIGWTTDTPIKAKVVKMRNEKYVRYKGQRVLSFDLTFKCNVALPEYIGLGKGVSKGFGVVRYIDNQSSTKQRKKYNHA